MMRICKEIFQNIGCLNSIEAYIPLDENERERKRKQKKKISFKAKERRTNFVLVLDFFLFDHGNNSSSLDDYI
jgi:hypothetical protein